MNPAQALLTGCIGTLIAGGGAFALGVMAATVRPSFGKIIAALRGVPFSTEMNNGE